MKKIELNSKNIIVIEIPKQSQDFKITNDYLTDISLVFYSNNNIEPDVVWLDEYKSNNRYKILGKLSELTDKDCEEFVKYYPQHAFYRNYVGGFDQAWDCGNSSKQSFNSLLESYEIDTNKELLIIIKT